MAKQTKKVIEKEGKKIVIIKVGDKVVRKRVMTVNNTPSLTDQSQKDQTIAKNIIKHYVKTGLITHLNQEAGKFADVSEVKSLYENMSKVKQVERYFMDLPSELRAKFDNDPQKMLEVIVDPAQEELQKELGLSLPVDPDTGKPITKEGKSEKDSGSTEVPPSDS
jgi:bifunctional DNA-binding transcriptional regulator/antitoxin component of YhaV-PrlF toxin-antitoxin module